MLMSNQAFWQLCRYIRINSGWTQQHVSRLGCNGYLRDHPISQSEISRIERGLNSTAKMKKHYLYRLVMKMVMNPDMFIDAIMRPLGEQEFPGLNGKSTKRGKNHGGKRDTKGTGARSPGNSQTESAGRDPGIQSDHPDIGSLEGRTGGVSRNDLEIGSRVEPYPARNKQTWHTGTKEIALA